MSIKVSVTSDRGTGKSEIHKVDFLELQGLIVKNEIGERRSEYSTLLIRFLLSCSCSVVT